MISNYDNGVLYVHIIQLAINSYTTSYLYICTLLQGIRRYPPQVKVTIVAWHKLSTDHC